MNKHMSIMAGLFLADATSGPGFIERQEKDGQRKLINSSRLPVEYQGNERLTDISKATGIIFGQKQGLFYDVELPVGWRLEPTSHSMWSDLLDNKGRKRGAVFYKAAFYDENAHWYLLPRYAVDSHYDNTDLAVEYRAVDRSTGKIMSSSGFIAANDYSKKGEAREELRAILKLDFPNYENPLLYWED